MAEFKLGRIRFVWKGDWATPTVYYKDDVVRYGGKTFICTTGHTSDADELRPSRLTPPRQRRARQPRLPDHPRRNPRAVGGRWGWR